MEAPNVSVMAKPLSRPVPLSKLDVHVTPSWHKCARVGEEYQASVPAYSSGTTNEKAYDSASGSMQCVALTDTDTGTGTDTDTDTALDIAYRVWIPPEEGSVSATFWQELDDLLAVVEPTEIEETFKVVYKCKYNLKQARRDLLLNHRPSVQRNWCDPEEASTVDSESSEASKPAEAAERRARLT